MGYLRVRDLGKAYKHYPAKWGRLAEWIGLGQRHELNWVLQDVSFDVAAGEAVGIVGANGAGKSTLLKLITSTVRPTTGAFEAGGRIAALLELGIGFNPEFTGRQNVYMAGHISGIPSDRIASLMNEIESFAEIGAYIDNPVRTYSSGMQVRLAFSVATAVRPDILIVDEALSVGDAYFRHKSVDRIRQFRDRGTTLLFVSHDPGAIKTLCDRAILLDKGLLLRDDSPEAVLDYYNALIAAQRADYDIRQSEQIGGRKVTRSGSAEVSIREVELLVKGRPVRAIRSGDAATIRIVVEAHVALPELTAGILIRDRLGNDVFGTNTYHLGARAVPTSAGDRMVVDFDFPSFTVGPGSFGISAALHTKDTHVAANYDWWDRAFVFEVVRGDGPLSIGVCALDVSARWLGASTTMVGASDIGFTREIGESGGDLPTGAHNRSTIRH
jgi:lipopolysaccharide transport system ATP-binding protein